MVDLHPFEDEAARYVLGEMDTAERRGFESQLERSAELRALVRELEAGMTAAALACPSHRPPPELWQCIERAVAEDARAETVVALEPRTRWLPYAWAAAACVMGGLLLSVWLTRNSSDWKPTQAEVQPPSSGSQREDVQTYGTLVSHPAPPSSQNTTNSTSGKRPARSSEPASRPIRFFSGAAASNAVSSPPLPAELQQALFVAVSRDLGGASEREPVAVDGVNVVDLRPPEAVPLTPPAMVTATGALVGGIAGDTLYLVFSSNTVPRGQELQFWVDTPEDGEQLLGTASLDEDPLVIMIPTSGPTSVMGQGGGTLTVIGVSPTGSSNVFGQIFIVAPSP